MIFEFGFLIVGLMQIFAFFVQGTTGFGATVISAPVTNGILGIPVGVPYGTIICIPFLYYLAIKGRKDISWKDLASIVLGCAPGLIIGQKLFYKMSPQTAKISIGSMIILIAVMNIYKHIIKPLMLNGEEEAPVEDNIVRKIFRYGCLILGGVVHGAFNIGGPLITVYTLEAVKDKKKFRNTMTSLWCILNVWNAFNQYRNGLFVPRLGMSLLVGMPFATLGFWLGMNFLEKINKAQFLRIVYLILFFIGINMTVRSLPVIPKNLQGAIIVIPVIIVAALLIILEKRTRAAKLATN
ncbi:sulfite exporter TauE/SafE family protein [uncultured Ilyobacter sp.]|uniref:sulfite exporter TauE/SafE family protein n=1 Tax=uncultured Ilyobacter sp. TaxID=544433 RepID=UPI0029C6C7C9|nr:sulfite exporter TauE/SafE family protein [uncultured Ilyobacter sp.]